MRPRAEEAGLSLGFEIDGSVPVAVESDPTWIRQILINLMGNALKFTKQGHVRVSVRHADRPGSPMLSFEVSDTGIGMSSQEIPGIFEAFVQADSSASRKYQGTGLGLTICERLTSLLGGTLDVKSELGKGSTFVLSLPVTVVDRGRLKAEGGVHSDPPRERDQRSRAPLLRLPSGCRVLIAEDRRDNQRLIADTLQRAGADVEFAEDGALAIDRARSAEEQRRPFDVILMDMQMPVLDGYQAVKKLREAGYRRPIIALTAHAMPGDRQRCIEVGCDDYAAKPIDRRNLIKMIAKCCSETAADGSA
jgi:CheY-like chemotaxis protein